MNNTLCYTIQHNRGYKSTKELVLLDEAWRAMRTKRRWETENNNLGNQLFESKIKWKDKKIIICFLWKWW